MAVYNIPLNIFRCCCFILLLTLYCETIRYFLKTNKSDLPNEDTIRVDTLQLDTIHVQLYTVEAVIQVQ